MSAKKSTKAKKPVVKVLKNRKTNALHDKLLKLFMRPQGATLEDTSKAGANRPAIAALNIFKKRGYKTSVVKKAGEPTRYLARMKA